jgi:4-hydroxybenzoate polyprenyltransferase
MKNPSPSPQPPLVVDLDGSLTRTDTLWETLWHLCLHAPLQALKMLANLHKGRAQFKTHIAEAALKTSPPWNPTTLPWNQEVLEFLKQEKKKGRHIVLATGATQPIAEAVQKETLLFDQILATNSGNNLKGPKKTLAIKDALQGRPFDYLGNENADLSVWACARKALIAEDSRPLRTLKTLQKNKPIEKVFPLPTSRWRTLLKTLRLNQWAKNLLVFAPMIASHSYDNPQKWAMGAITFFAFSLCASGAYLLNDLVDLPHDRSHHTKKKRPLAQGTFPLPYGLLLAGILPLLGSLLAWAYNLLPYLFLYYTCTVAYSLFFKKIAIIDVTLLAGLYCLRTVTGGAATEDPVSLWMATFGGFLFLSLACLKRHSELLNLQKSEQQKTHGRDYHVEDLPLIQSIGVSAGCIAPLVLTLYLQNHTPGYYNHPENLWASACLVFVWIMNLWRDSTRGSLKEEDPLSYSLSNKKSLLILCLLASSLLLATHLP